MRKVFAMSGIGLERIDHIVFTVQSIEKTCAFYARVLGLTVQAYVYGGAERKSLHFGEQKINLHEAGNEFEPKARRPAPGAIDICFITKTPIDEVIAHLVVCGVAIVDGPGVRNGAIGRMRSVYFRDPDQNLIEVSNYAEADAL